MLFGSRDTAKTIVLVDTLSSSVGAAYARIAPDKPVSIMYSVRVDVPDDGQPPSTVRIFRALDEALKRLRSEGAPYLRKETGSGSADAVYACVGASWQETEVRVELITDDKPFVLTAADIEKAKSRANHPEGTFCTEESIVATLLNGYEVGNAVGKKATKAEIILLSSIMEKDNADLVRRALAGFSSAHSVAFTSFASMIYRALPAAFPHEKDYLALRVEGQATELVHVARGYPTNIARVPLGMTHFARAAKAAGFSSFPDGGDVVDRDSGKKLGDALEAAKAEWIREVEAALKAFAANRALPRTVFILSEADARTFVKSTLDVPIIRALWLIEEALPIVMLDESHFASALTIHEDVPQDLPLSILALASRGHALS